jgi:hypothetical protein
MFYEMGKVRCFFFFFLSFFFCCCCILWSVKNLKRNISLKCYYHLFASDKDWRNCLYQIKIGGPFLRFRPEQVPQGLVSGFADASNDAVDDIDEGSRIVGEVRTLKSL